MIWPDTNEEWDDWIVECSQCQYADECYDETGLDDEEISRELEKLNAINSQ
jgi:hypothetical protein